MAKIILSSFVLSLELKGNRQLFSVALDKLEAFCVMYNKVYGKYLHLEKHMKREKKYKSYIRQLE
ncbi:hypothetical protein [Bacillus sp. FSL K6-3431]|uniref:hypothetical protein n=1 Tax=Bacillus sp. FSL K6-3431 TaxID=2921500 RepID=UPI0030F58159